MIGSRIWRVSSLERPIKLEGFNRSSKQEILLTPGALAQTIARHFEIDQEKVALALACLEQNQPGFADRF